MKERLIAEAKRYVKFTHQEWGSISGLALGFGVGIYATVEYTSKADISDVVLKILLQATTIPFSAGLCATILSNAGAAIDIITQKNTLASWVYTKAVNCRNAIRDREAEHLFFNTGSGYYRSSKPGLTELTLRHQSSGESNDVTIRDTSPRLLSTTEAETSGSDVGEVVVGFQQAASRAVSPSRGGTVTL